MKILTIMSVKSSINKVSSIRVLFFYFPYIEKKYRVLAYFQTRPHFTHVVSVEAWQVIENFELPSGAVQHQEVDDVSPWLVLGQISVYEGLQLVTLHFGHPTVWPVLRTRDNLLKPNSVNV